MAETRTSKTKAPAPKGGGKHACTVQGCKRAYRAKGLCFFHYRKWRRGELEGRPPRYDTCGKEACHKKVVERGLCQEHLAAWKASRKSARLAGAAPAEKPPAEAPPAAPAA
jgi:hypothetical protein